jgi:hypothetical protein
MIGFFKGVDEVGFKYLDGNRWEEVTREERFYCQRLFELVRGESVEGFVQYLIETLSLEISPIGEWELGFEVCFYRDLWQLRNRNGALYSPKRTFDLCLFGESAIIIIEAKAASGFDQMQNNYFREDIKQVREITKVEAVRLVGLCSSHCELDEDTMITFERRIVFWRDLAARYNNDMILKRANDIYNKAEIFTKYGRNSDVKLSGSALLEAYRGGASWWVGRGGGGFLGDRFLNDVQSGLWRTQMYEVNTSAEAAPSPNFFGLDEFARAVGEDPSGRSSDQ